MRVVNCIKVGHDKENARIEQFKGSRFLETNILTRNNARICICTLAYKSTQIM